MLTIHFTAESDSPLALAQELCFVRKDMFFGMPVRISLDLFKSRVSEDCQFAYTELEICLKSWQSSLSVILSELSMVQNTATAAEQDFLASLS